MDVDGPRLEVDFRERNSLTVPALEAAGVRLHFLPLKTGDYRVGDTLLIERKTVWDFRESLFDGRLFSQLARLAQASPRPLLLLEGLDRAVSEPVFRGALITATGVFGVPVLFAKDPADSAAWIVAAAKQFQARREHAVARPGWRPRGKRARQIFVLQGLPGIGPVRAERLLDRFGTVRAVLAASEMDLRDVAGVGPSIARRIVWLAT